MSLPPQSSASTNSATSPILLKHSFVFVSYPEQDSNLHISRHSHLKRARLPFRHLGITKQTNRAKDGIRTRDPNLGKVMLYQLSYFRDCGCKGRYFFEICKHLAYFFQQKISESYSLQNNLFDYQLIRFR